MSAYADDTASDMVKAWTDWVATQGIASGQLVVTHNGVPQARTSVGGASGPVDIASLSKAITALCLADLVAEGALNWSDPVKAHLNVAPPLSEVTVAALVTHTAGLTPDSTQDRMPAWRGAGDVVYDQVLDRISERAMGGTDWRYNNENYAVLGALIAAVSGQSDTSACNALTLDPAGVTSARPSPRYGRFAAWGGWEMELADYARLIWHRFANMSAPDLPHAAVGRGAEYGLGMFWRPHRGGGYNYWHFGALCFADTPGFMTYSVLWGNGWGASVHVEGCPGDNWFGSLDTAMVGAVFR